MHPFKYTWPALRAVFVLLPLAGSVGSYNVASPAVRMEPLDIQMGWILEIAGIAILSIALAIVLEGIFRREMLKRWRFNPLSSTYYGFADVLFTVGFALLALSIASAVDYRSDGARALHNCAVLATYGLSFLGATFAAQLLLHRYFPAR